MIRLSFLVALLLTSEAVAGPKLDAETAAAANVYTHQYLFGKLTAVHPAQLPDGRWYISVPTRPELGILVDADFSATCLVTGSPPMEIAAHLSGAMSAMLPQLMRFSKDTEGRCAALVWVHEGALYALATARLGSEVRASLVSQTGQVIDIQRIDPSIDELANPFLSVETVWRLLNLPVPLGEVRRLAFHKAPDDSTFSLRILEVRDGKLFVRLLHSEGDEKTLTKCDQSAIDARSSGISQKAREALSSLSGQELDVALVPFSDTVLRSIDVSAYVLCGDG